MTFIHQFPNFSVFMLASAQGDGDITLGRREEVTEACAFLPVVSTSSSHPSVSGPLPSYSRSPRDCCPGGACLLSQVCISAFYWVWCRRVHMPFHPTFGWHVLLIGEGPGSNDPYGLFPWSIFLQIFIGVIYYPSPDPGRLVLTLPLWVMRLGEVKAYVQGHAPYFM